MPCLHEQMYSAHSHCCVATLHIATRLRLVIRGATEGAWPFIRKKATLNRSLFVRIKGLEPPRLSASDPKSDVATNYTISAGSLALNTLA